MIKIVTDSTAYLPEATVRQHDLRIVPLCVHFGEEAFKEGVELSHEEFYARLKAAPVLPTTSQPSAGEFHEVFKELVDAGHEVVVLTISSKLSGTWNSAMAAKEMLPEAKICVIDSLSTSIGLQLMVGAAIEAAAAISVIDSLSTAIGLQLMLAAAVEAAQAGASRQEILDQVEEIKARIHVLFVVDTLEYLAKGGRIGNAKAFMGTLLKVKPILVLQDGVIEPLEQVRSKQKAQARMLDLVEEYVGGKGAQAKVAICGALVPEEVNALSRDLVGRLGCEQPSISEIGPVIGTHTGPGVIGVAVYV
jgi:fatty acid-binding protein DegV